MANRKDPQVGKVQNAGKSNPREELLKLVDQLEVGLTPEDAREHLENLNDEEVKLLLEMYGAVAKFEEEVEAAAKEADPEEYAKAEDEYQKQLLQLKQNYNHRKQQIQAKADDQLDKLEAETRGKYRDLLYQQQLEFSHLDDDHKAIYSKLTAALAK
jgi:transketolase